jgi:hypothetical protein
VVGAHGLGQGGTSCGAAARGHADAVFKGTRRAGFAHVCSQRSSASASRTTRRRWSLRTRAGWARLPGSAPQAAARRAAAARSGLGHASGVHCSATDIMRGCATGLPHPDRPAQ